MYDGLYVKYRILTDFPGMENLWKGELAETMRKLCLTTRFPPQEIRWNYGILRSRWFFERCFASS